MLSGIPPNPVPSQSHGPLCCFMLAMSRLSNFLPPRPTPTLSQHQHLRNYWQKSASELQKNVYAAQYLPLSLLSDPQKGQREK